MFLCSGNKFNCGLFLTSIDTILNIKNNCGVQSVLVANTEQKGIENGLTRYFVFTGLLSDKCELFTRFWNAFFSRLGTYLRGYIVV